MPLSKPVIATVAVLQFLSRWGELLWPVMADCGFFSQVVCAL